ncbi:MAG: hypothetical protein EOP48_19750 [Sphingobacteriales bacterium]|nr:MAG: hypothetical protein EOP48_19750 [Sphingobacteriales bacterium]
MKKVFLSAILICSFLISWAQNQNYILTVKITSNYNSTTGTYNQSTDFIKVAPNGTVSTTTTTVNNFTQTAQFEQILHTELNSITSQGYELVNSTLIGFGGIPTQNLSYQITRYIFKQR